MSTTSDSTPQTPQVIGPGRKSSFSPADNCVELFDTTDPQVKAMRNSNDYSQGTLFIRRTALAELLDGAKAGELDDMI